MSLLFLFQALVEMADLAQAATCVNYHQNVPAMIGRTQVLLQFSATHKELKTEKVPNGQVRRNSIRVINVISMVWNQVYKLVAPNYDAVLLGL